MVIMEAQDKEVVDTTRYDFYDVVDAEKEDGTAVKIKQLSGSFTLKDLEQELQHTTSQKEYYEAEIIKLQEKIAEIAKVAEK